MRMIDALAGRGASGQPRVTIVPPALRIGSSTGFLTRSGQMYDVNGLPPIGDVDAPRRLVRRHSDRLRRVQRRRAARLQGRLRGP